MSSSTKRGVTQNPREAGQGIRKSVRISKRQPGDHARKPEGGQTRRSISSKDTKMPKIIKSASSTEKQKLDILFTVLREITLRSRKVMRIVIVIKVNHHLRHHFGDLQICHQELGSFLK
jgi:hypothetical protein